MFSTLTFASEALSPEEPEKKWSAKATGYLKTFAIGGTSLATDGEYFQSLSSARLIGTLSYKDVFQAEAAYELQPVFQAGSSRSQTTGSALPRSSKSPYRLVDLPVEIAANATREVVLFENLDRLNVRWSAKFLDLTFGRQAITFGSANSISPTDVLLPFAFQQVNVEYRIGVDALRLQIPLGKLAELDLGAIMGDHLQAKESAAFLRTTFDLKGQWAITAAWYRTALLLGLGLERELGPLGWKTDVAVTSPPGEKVYARATTGVTYSFGKGTALTGDYHYNGAGANRAADYYTTASKFGFSRGGVFLLGTHYLILGAAHPFHPLVNANFQWIMNLLDPSAYATAALDWSIVENLFLDVGVFIPVGRRTDSTAFVATSEFGLYPISGYTALRWYF